MKDNELIAEFMGLVFKKEINGIKYYSVPPGHTASYNASIGQFFYHKSWDWLMPVVEKIETLYDTGIFYDGNRQPNVHNIRVYAKRGGSETIVIAYGKSKIETIYEAVILFIKWYNANK